MHRMTRTALATLTAILTATLTTILAPCTASAQEYSLYGNFELGTTAARVRLPATTVETLATDAVLRLNHLMAYTWGEAVVRHRFTVADLGAGPGTHLEADLGADLGADPDPLRHDLLQAALVMWPTETLTLQVGRHSLPWGMGSAFFPADALHPVRTRDGEDRGFDGGSATWTISPRWTVTGAGRVDTARAAVEEPWRDLRWAGLLAGYLGRVDVMASTVYQPDAVLRPAAGISLPLGDLIVHGEGSLELSGVSSRERGPAGATGMHYTVYAGVHAITFAVEYLYTEQGAPPDPDATVPEATDPDATVPYTAGRHFLYPIFSWDGDGRWSADWSSLIDLEESRALVRLEVSRHILDTLTLAAEVIFPVHEKTGSDPWEGLARIRARVHF
jgi:hypothetical protein